MTKEVWNRAATSYEDVLAGQYTQAIDPLLDAALVGSKTKVLDVGTGPGSIAASAGLRGAEVIGVDYAPAMIETARNTYPDIEFQVADAVELPFPDESFDAVVMGFTLFLLSHPEDALQEVFRVLRTAGRFAFTVWDGATPGHKAFGEALARHVDWPNPFAGLPLVGVNDEATLTNVVLEAGFVDVELQQLPINWRIEKVDQLFDAFAPMYDLGNLDSEQMASFRLDVVSNTEAFKQDGQILVPFPALLVSCAKMNGNADNQHIT